MSEEKITDKLKRIRDELFEIEDSSIRISYKDLSPGDWYRDGGAWREVASAEVCPSGLVTLTIARTDALQTAGVYNPVQVIKAGT